MKKLKLAVIFGGQSTEHNVSIVSGTSVIQNLKKEKYEIVPIYISNNGEWFEYTKEVKEIKVLKIGEEVKELKKIENIYEALKDVDVIFPVLHGLYGEDGSIQGLFKLLNKKYVGCNIISSAICMDKAYAKIIFEKAKIPQAKYIYLRKRNNKYVYLDDNFNEINIEINKLSKKVKKELDYPVFIKPSNSGSSVGMTKAHNSEELETGIELASKYDNKILIEENIVGREIECAVLGNDKVDASCIGEIIPAEDYYTFDAKYNNKESLVQIPANITAEEEKNIKDLAIKAYKAVDASGLARADFFIEKDSGTIIINEINTLPGFTEISMYPKLWKQSGIMYSDLLDKIIELAENK